MKQTINANIGGRAFNIDQDAYELLERYLRDIESRIAEGDRGTMEDVEGRVAEMFNERISSQMQVVNIEMVRRAMASIGRPDLFGAPRGGFRYPENEGESQNSTGTLFSKRLWRSRENKVLGGVCGGISEYFDIDPNVVRLLTALLVIPGGMSLWVYIVMWAVLPLRPINEK